MDKSTKMLHVLMGLEIGGAETHVVELLKELKKEGYDVIAASNGGVYEKELEQAGIKHYKVPLNKRNIFSIIKSYKLLKEIIIKEKIQMVHAHARIPGFVCGLLHRKLEFTFVTTAHWVFFTGMGLKYMTNWGQKVIAVSEDIKKYLMDNYKTKEENIFLTINGIDTEKFSPSTDARDIVQEFNINNDETVIVYVSRMDEDRSQVAGELMDCVPSLLKEVEKLKVIVVGSGNDFESKSNKAKEINATVGMEVIYMAGARTDINKLIAVGDIFIGVSRAALEAMAVQKPVIVAGNEGFIGTFEMSKLANAIENNFTCRGNEASSKEKILKEIRYILSLNEAQRKQLGIDGRNVIFNYYSVEKMAKDCIKAYDAALLEDNKPKQVVIFGYYGFGNWGDEASLSAIINMIRKTQPDTLINVLSYNGSNTEQVYGVKGVSRNNYRRILKAVKRSDIVIFGGGTLLQDVTSSRSLYYYLFIIWIAKKYNKKIVFFSNGFGPIIKNKEITAKIATKANDIIVRDQKSKDMMVSLGIKNKIEVSTDVVFDFEKVQNKEKQNKIAVSLRPWKYSVKLIEQIAQAVDALIDKGYSIDLVPIQNVDKKVFNILINYLKNKDKVTLYEGKNFTDTIERIAESRIMIGMRLHANIFALINDIPIITINYDPKIEALSQDFGQKIIHLQDKSICEKILSEVSSIENEYEQRVELVRQRTKVKKELLRINYQYLRRNICTTKENNENKGK